MQQRRRLLFLLGGAVVLVLGLLASQLWAGRKESLREAAAKSRNYAAIIEARLDATLRRADSVLLSQVHEVPREALDAKAVPEFAGRIRAELDRYLLTFAEVAGLRIYDGSGALLYFSSGDSAPRSSIDDRAYFRALRDDHRAELVFSEVLSIQSTGRDGVVAGRAVRDGSGALLAVVTALIDLETFKQLFRSLDVGPGGLIVVRRSDDFRGVVRWPPLEREINRPLPADHPIRGALQSDQAQGTLDFAATSDGVHRTFSYRGVQGYPFYVAVALSHADVLAGWRERSLAVGLAGSVLLAAVCLLLARLWRIEAREAQTLVALRESEERLRLALVASRQGLYDLNVQTGETEVNDQYALMLGYDPATFRETNQAWIERLHPDEREPVAHLYQDYIAGRTPEYRVEFRQRAADGSWKWILSVGKVVEWDREGRPLRMLGTHRDISQRKQADAALHRLNEELEDRVARRTAELVQARDEAERANRAKSEFLSGMSHELRTPMNAILGFAQLLSTEPVFAGGTREGRQLHEITRAGQHLLRLIDDLLDLACIEAGKQPIDLESVPVADLVHECLSLVEPTAREAGITLACRVDASFDGRVQADRMRLKQVLLNLLSNAIKYDRRNGAVSVECSEEASALRIVVADTGPGLTEQERSRLFRDFERLGADKTSIRGAGIGLALSRRLVEAMHGEIGVDSEPGVGSRFWVRLPKDGEPRVDAGAADVRAAASTAANAAAPARTVLYIEDDPVNLLLMESVLARHPQWRLLTAPLPEQGLQLATEHRPDLILLDIQLPGFDGYEVLRRLREHDATRRIPVIAVSANAMSVDRTRAEAADFADYLTKPLDLQRLMTAMEAALELAAHA